MLWWQASPPAFPSAPAAAAPLHSRVLVASRYSPRLFGHLHVILDTNALCAWLDGDPALQPHLETAQRISLSPIVLGEFRFGILGSRHRARYEQRLRLIEREFPPLPINGVTAGHYAALRRELAGKGRPIPWHDLWIAAQARQHQLAILSRDEHFDAVLNLQRISW